MIQPATTASGTSGTTTPRFETEYHEETAPARYDPLVSARVTWWGAIVAGAFASISIQVIFAVLGTAIGLSVLSAANDAPEAGLSIGGAIYWVITGLVSLFIGGYVAGRLRNTSDGRVGAMHGFLTWCTVTVLSAMMIAMAGSAAIGGSLAVVGDAMAANASTDGNASMSRDSGAMSRDSRPVTDEERKETAGSAAGASWWTLIALVLGATVASIGGRTGVRDFAARTHTTTTRRQGNRSKGD